MVVALWQGTQFGSGASRGMEFLFGGWEFAPIITLQQGLGLTPTQDGLLNLGGERAAGRIIWVTEHCLPISRRSTTSSTHRRFKFCLRRPALSALFRRLVIPESVSSGAPI